MRLPDMTIDPKVYDLAEAFLADEPSLNTEAAKVTLAYAIQRAAEDELEFIRSALKPTAIGASA
jgi:hypothetical protein